MSILQQGGVVRLARPSAIGPATHWVEYHRLMTMVWDTGIVSVAEVVERAGGYRRLIAGTVHARCQSTRSQSVLTQAGTFFGEMSVAEVTQADIDRFIEEIDARLQKAWGLNIDPITRSRCQFKALVGASRLLDELAKWCPHVAPRLKPISEDLRARCRAHQVAYRANLPKRRAGMGYPTRRKPLHTKKSGDR